MENHSSDGMARDQAQDCPGLGGVVMVMGYASAITFLLALVARALGG